MKRPGLGMINIALSAVVLAAILLSVDAQRLFSIIAGADLAMLAAAILTYFCTMLLMSWRIKFILGRLGSKVAFAKAFMANCAGLLASDFTPARAGYFATPFVLEKSSRVPLNRGMAAIVSPQIVEFFLKAVGAACAIMLIFNSLQLAQATIYLWLGVGVMLAFCAALAALLFVPQALAAARRLSFLPFVEECCGFVASLQKHRNGVGGAFPVIIAISVAVFFLKGLEWYFFGAALGVGFSAGIHPFLVFCVLQPLITVFQFVPFPTVAGLGLSEGGAVASMVLLGVPAEMAVAYSLLVRGATTLADCLGVRELFFVIAPKRGI